MIQIEHMKTDEPLAQYTTYGIGGPADYFIAAKSTGEFVSAIIAARKARMPYFILGLGANILFGDKGFRGLVIRNEARGFRFEGSNLIAEGGAVVGRIIQECERQSLSGLEHYAGIPSTVGGALWQNLHFLSPDRLRTVFIEEVLLEATLLTTDNTLVTVGRDFFRFGYDYSILHDEELIVVEATFALEQKPRAEIEAVVQANLKWRNEKQPSSLKYMSCGSVFKKIEGVGAGRLIDQVGLKGVAIGGIRSCEEHANFLVNDGTGRAVEVRALIALIQQTVKRETGYDLETEISFVGEF